MTLATLTASAAPTALASVSDLVRLDPEQPADAGRIEAEIDLASRERYLAWVRAWKAEYKALSAEIRRLKAVLRPLDGCHADFWPAHAQIGRLRCRAWNLLVVRRAGKRLSAARRAACAVQA